MTEVLTAGTSALFKASRDSAVRAIIAGQTFDMLRPEHYEAWKDIEITFDPREKLRLSPAKPRATTAAS